MQIAPGPSIAGHDRTHHRVLRIVKMLCGVLPWRRVTTTDVTTGHALSEFDPCGSLLQTFFAAIWRPGSWEIRLGKVLEVFAWSIHQFNPFACDPDLAFFGAAVSPQSREISKTPNCTFLPLYPGIFRCRSRSQRLLYPWSRGQAAVKSRRVIPNFQKRDAKQMIPVIPTFHELKSGFPGQTGKTWQRVLIGVFRRDVLALGRSGIRVNSDGRPVAVR